MSTSNFGERLKQLRREKNLTQEQLADVFGIARNSIFSYETGRRIPDIEVLKSYAEYFGVTSDYLLGISDNRTPETAAIGNKLGLSDDAIERLTAYANFQNAFEAVASKNGKDEDYRYLQEAIFFESFKHLHVEGTHPEGAIYQGITILQDTLELLIKNDDVLEALFYYLFGTNDEAVKKITAGETINSDDEETEAVNMYRLVKRIIKLRHECYQLPEESRHRLHESDLTAMDYYYNIKRPEILSKISNNQEETNAEEN